MVAEPAATPVTMPVELFTLALEVSLLVHVPLEVRSVSGKVAPTHTLLLLPLIGDGVAGAVPTVTTA